MRAGLKLSRPLLKKGPYRTTGCSRSKTQLPSPILYAQGSAYRHPRRSSPSPGYSRHIYPSIDIPVWPRQEKDSFVDTGVNPSKHSGLHVFFNAPKALTRCCNKSSFDTTLRNSFQQPDQSFDPDKSSGFVTSEPPWASLFSATSLLVDSSFSALADSCCFFAPRGGGEGALGGGSLASALFLDT